VEPLFRRAAAGRIQHARIRQHPADEVAPPGLAERAKKADEEKRDERILTRLERRRRDSDSDGDDRGDGASGIRRR
jgi:hypothetical protein